MPTIAATFAERVLLPEGRVLEITLRAGGGAAPRYCLRIGPRAGGEAGWVLQYDNTAGHRRVLRDRAAPYAFRSIEQLRYDFERDLEALTDDEETQA